MRYWQGVKENRQNFDGGGNPTLRGDARSASVGGMQTCRFCGELHRVDELCRARRVNRRTFFGVFAAGVVGMVALPRGWIYDPLAAKAEAITLRAATQTPSWWTTVVPAEEVVRTFDTMSVAVRRVFQAHNPTTYHWPARSEMQIRGMWRFDGGYARLCPQTELAPGYHELVTPDHDPEQIAYFPSGRRQDSPTRG